MKKITLFILILVSIFVSCAKIPDEQHDNSISTINFEVDVFAEGKPITKSLTNDAVNDLIASTIPDFYFLRAQNLENGNTYDFDTKTEVKLPNGIYQVKILEQDKNNNIIRWDSKRKNWSSNVGHRCDDEFVYRQDVGWIILCNSPRICACDTVSIEKNGTISLNAIIGSSAIVWDASIVDHINICETGNNGVFQLKCFVESDNVCVTFHDNTTSTPIASIEIIPKEDVGYEKRALKIPGVLKQGYWYMIEPYKQNSSQAGFIVGIGSFIDGGSL